MKDDRYRINQTPEAISVSMFEVLNEYGRDLAVDEQVAISKRLSIILQKHGGPLTRADVLEAFESIKVRRPPNGFWRALRDRLERVVG